MFRSLFTQFTPAGLGFAGQVARWAVTRAASLAAITLLALGMLSGTAQAQFSLRPLPAQSFFADLRLYHYMTNVPQAGGGDAEVGSKSGRYTDVMVQTSQPYVYPDGLSGYIAVSYYVYEGGWNYTQLQKTDLVYFYAPPGCRIVSTGINRRPANFSQRFYGQSHVFHDMSWASKGTYLQSVSLRFDGPGRDDQGNAALATEIMIGVELVRN